MLCHCIKHEDCDTFYQAYDGTVLYASKAVKDARTNLSYNMMLESSTFWSGGMALQLARHLEWSSHLGGNFSHSNIWYEYIRLHPSWWVESGQLGLNEVMLISWLSMPISQSIPTRPRRSNTAIKSGHGSTMCCRKPLVDVYPYCAWMPMEELEMDSFLFVSGLSSQPRRTIMAASFVNFWTSITWQQLTRFSQQVIHFILWVVWKQ